MTTTPDGDREQRRTSSSSRRRRSQRTEVPAFVTALRNPVSGRIIAFLMALVTIVYIGGTYRAFSFELGSYAGVPLEGSYDDTLYAVGRPALVSGAGGAGWRPYRDGTLGDTWRYNSLGGGTIDVDFSGGQVRSVTCTDINAIIGACPDSFGITVGHTEEQLVVRFGRPAAQALVAQRKLLAYESVGMNLALETYTIMKMRRARVPENGGGARTLLFLRSILP